MPRKYIFLFITLVILFSLPACSSTAVNFPDPNLERAVRYAVDKPKGRIYAPDLEGLTSLSATSQYITNLTGLQYCVNLAKLDLSENQIPDISPLASLTNLTELRLGYNQISDVSPLP